MSDDNKKTLSRLALRFFVATGKLTSGARVQSDNLPGSYGTVVFCIDSAPSVVVKDETNNLCYFLEKETLKVV